MLYNFITLAQAAEAGRPSWLIGGMPIFLLVIMMFFLFRSQKKQGDKRKDMIAKTKVGDQIVTNGGMKGTVTKVKETSFMIKIADKIEVEIIQNGVGAVIEGDKGDE